MRNFCHSAFLLVAFLGGMLYGQPAEPEGVVLLHGLLRSPRSMTRMEKQLGRAGYVVVNVGYPSRHYPIEKLAPMAVEDGIDACRTAGCKTIHFVAHSLGNILLREYLATNTIPELGRIVMLSPPNHGSEVTDKLGGWRLYRWMNGPAGSQLGTHSNSVPCRLGPLDADFGVLTGRHTINFILSGLIPGPDDGKVSTASAKLEGMDDFRIMPVSHPYIMRDRDVIREVLHYLRQGCFTPQSGADGVVAVRDEAPPAH